MPDSRVQKWQRWLEDHIRPEVLSMHWYRAVYRKVGEIVDNANLPPSHFFTYSSEIYAQTQSVAIRRQAEIGSRVITLGSLMKELADDSTRLTRSLYVSMYDDHAREMADPDFDRLAGRGAAHMPHTKLQANLRALRQATTPISDYVDRHLAHVDRDPLPALPTHSDLNRAIDAIGDAFNQCSQIVTASSWATLEPIVQEDWLAVFRQPWIRPRR